MVQVKTFMNAHDIQHDQDIDIHDGIYNGHCILKKKNLEEKASDNYWVFFKGILRIKTKT